ncbi:MAG: cytochrome b N-terminal domain-containing protein [Neomegalonema sp.]|nr:cytochrome b N-terminal domain-containing protein [Neomegalonema sp.]
MSGGHIPQEHYTPQSKAEKWLDHRLPVGGLMHHLNSFPTPKNLNWWWIFGGVLAVCLVVQIVTGIGLAMHYVAHVDHAFASVEHIMRDVIGGWWLRYVHANGASFFFIAVYLHIFRGLYYGSYKAPREILWIVGVLIYLLMMATAFMGYVLPWGQMSFWGAQVITGLFSAIPGVGKTIQAWLLGGPAVDQAALNRFFSLHYLLPFAIAGLVAVHIWALHHVGNNNPSGVSVRNTSVDSAKKDTVPFSPYYTVKDAFGIVIFLIIFAVFVFYMPNYLGHPDNYIEANSRVTPEHIVPEWYFLPFYAILRSIDNKLLGVLAMFASIGILAVLPWLDTSRVRSGAYRPSFRWFFWIFVVACIGLGYVGSKDPAIRLIEQSEEFKFRDPAKADEKLKEITTADKSAEAAIQISYHKEEDGESYMEYSVKHVHMAFTMKNLGQLLMIYYFAYFLLILPILGVRERARPRPDSIDADFQAKMAKKRKAAAPAAQPAE